MRPNRHSKSYHFVHCLHHCQRFTFLSVVVSHAQIRADELFETADYCLGLRTMMVARSLFPHLQLDDLKCLHSFVARMTFFPQRSIFPRRDNGLGPFLLLIACSSIQRVSGPHFTKARLYCFKLLTLCLDLPI